MSDDVTAIMQAQAQYDATLDLLFAGSTDDEVRAELDAAIDMRHWYEADLASDELERRERKGAHAMTAHTHDPQAVERIAEAMFVACYGPGHTITYQRLKHDGDPWKDGVFCKPYWRQQAVAALTAIDELYETEAGE